MIFLDNQFIEYAFQHLTSWQVCFEHSNNILDLFYTDYLNDIALNESVNVKGVFNTNESAD